MMVLISYGLKEINLLYLLPLTEAGWPNIISGSTETLMAMFGFEFFSLCFLWLKVAAVANSSLFL